MNAQAIVNKLLWTGTLALGLACAACEDGVTADAGVGRDATAGMDATVNEDGGSTPVCDPNAGTESVRMLNATPEQGVEVIKKTPAHPGAPGPEGLP